MSCNLTRGRKDRGNSVTFPKSLKFEWEFEILKLIETRPDYRALYWYWEPIGGVGKTSFAKYLCVKHNAIMVGGGAADMKYALAGYKVKPRE